MLYEIDFDADVREKLHLQEKVIVFPEADNVPKFVRFKLPKIENDVLLERVNQELPVKSMPHTLGMS